MPKGIASQTPSENRKLKGKRPGAPFVFATYRAVGPTCPGDCAVIDSGCYAKLAPVSYLSARAQYTETDYVAWAMSLPKGSLIRWNVSGDIVGEDGPEYREQIKQAHILRPDLKGWLYTHAHKDPAIRNWLKTLPKNINVIASCDTENDVISAYLAGFKTVAFVVKGSDIKGAKDIFDKISSKRARTDTRYLADSAGVRSVACPAQREEPKGVGCADCLACLDPGLVLFAAHGGYNAAMRSLDKVRLRVIL